MMTPQRESMVKQLTDIYANLLYENIEPSGHVVTLTQAQYKRLLNEIYDGMSPYPCSAQDKRFLGMKLEVI